MKINVFADAHCFVVHHRISSNNTWFGQGNNVLYAEKVLYNTKKEIAMNPILGKP